MSDDPNAGAHSSHTGGPFDLIEGAAAFVDIKAHGEAAAASIDKAFERAGLSLAKSLTKAASDGKISLAELASAAIQVIEVFTRGAGSSGGAAAGGGLVDAMAGLFKDLFGGARADGGPVSGGGAYLVGERGPEVFRPYTAGEISTLGRGGGATVNVTIQGGGAPAILRSEAQIAAALARAVSLGAGGSA